MDRDPAHERHLTSIAAHAGNLVGPDPDTPHPSVRALDDFADRRTMPGPVRTQCRDLKRDAAEEIADCRNYLVWDVQRHLPAFLAGDADAADEYARAMRALSLVQRAFDALYG